MCRIIVCSCVCTYVNAAGYLCDNVSCEKKSYAQTFCWSSRIYIYFYYWYTLTYITDNNNVVAAAAASAVAFSIQVYVYMRTQHLQIHCIAHMWGTHIINTHLYIDTDTYSCTIHNIRHKMGNAFSTVYWRCFFLTVVPCVYIYKLQQHTLCTTTTTKQREYVSDIILSFYYYRIHRHFHTHIASNNTCRNISEYSVCVCFCCTNTI